MISLKATMARRRDAAFTLIQHSLIIAGLLLVAGALNVLAKSSPAAPDVPAVPVVAAAASGAPAAPAADPARLVVAAATPADDPAQDALSPRMQGALDYVKRRYRVSAEALQPVFEVAQLIGKERRIDPLLIVAMIGIESGFNPFAESTMGAQGLMQVIPRFHRDKVPHNAGDKPLLDPLINITVGVRVLEEAIRRSGGLVPGLQHYAGSADDPDEAYASKVLAEKERLENAARRAKRPSSSA